MSADDKADAAWDDYVSQQQEEKIEELERELNAANDRIKRLEEDLSDAYAEMRKQYPVIKAVFDSSVWTKANKAKP